MRLGTGRAIKGMILVELLLRYVNLGVLIRTWSSSYPVDGVLSVVILLYGIPYIFAGLRLGIGRAVKGPVVTERLISLTRLGAILTQANASVNWRSSSASSC